MANTAAERELLLTAKPSQHPEIRGDSEVCFVAVNLSPHTAHAPLSKVQVTLVVQPPLVADPPCHTIQSLSKSFPFDHYCWAYIIFSSTYFIIYFSISLLKMSPIKLPVI